jgi:hypothetical protein
MGLPLTTEEGPPEGEEVASDDLRFPRRNSARCQQKFDTSIAQPVLPFPDYAGHGPQALVSDLQRHEAEQSAGASFLESLLIICLGISGGPLNQPQNGAGCLVENIATFWHRARFWRDLNDWLWRTGYAITHRTAPLRH